VRRAAGSRARWHFSFDRYRDPEQMGAGALRVFNDDRIVAGAEWPLHPHQDIESLTYVVEGPAIRPRECLDPLLQALWH
jgi:redox-sensitive bicupin YhaK (pirin superfamily)